MVPLVVEAWWHGWRRRWHWLLKVAQVRLTGLVRERYVRRIGLAKKPRVASLAVEPRCLGVLLALMLAGLPRRARPMGGIQPELVGLGVVRKDVRRVCGEEVGRPTEEERWLCIACRGTLELDAVNVDGGRRCTC